ncbi:Alpha-1-antitrypsin 1-4 [Apodemus speciosus]|uniref:Alpha-1-antitrypsin 1-4 n=1 Tax=Apodemus speciosus TaxID=105296 RepID=A0ABQ0FES9_APOSI
MLSLGAKTNTDDQILEGLNFNLTETPENLIYECFHHLTFILHQVDHQKQLTINSSLLIDQNLKLKDKFVKDVKRLYDSKVIDLNFNDIQRTQNQINEYIEEETHGEIAGLVKEMEADTASALINYIFFQGKVEPPGLVGLKEDTQMCVHDQNCDIDPFLEHGFFLSLQGCKWFDDFEVEDIGEQDFHVNSDMTVKVPMIHQLSITSTYDPKTILGTLGITEIFSNEADLSGVTQDAPLKLSKGCAQDCADLGRESDRTYKEHRLEEEGLASKLNYPLQQALPNCH